MLSDGAGAFFGFFSLLFDKLVFGLIQGA